MGVQLFKEASWKGGCIKYEFIFFHFLPMELRNEQNGTYKTASFSHFLRSLQNKKKNNLLGAPTR